MSREVYLHNSKHKNYIRTKWIEFAKEIYKNDSEEFGIITFPAEEMQDLILFAKHGLIEWEKTETDSYRINRGKVVCFEKSSSIFAALQSKLVNAKVEPSDIGTFLRVHYSKFMAGRNTHFPVHTVNLDFDNNLSKNIVGIDECIDLVFKFQNLHNRSFSLFLTWPSTFEEDDYNYKELLNGTIQSNIDLNEDFRVKFIDLHKSIENLDYDRLSIIGISKIIIDAATKNLFTLDKNEFYVYGEANRRKMYSVLYNLKFTNKKGMRQTLYHQNVLKALTTITNLKDVVIV